MFGDDVEKFQGEILCDDDISLIINIWGHKRGILNSNNYSHSNYYNELCGKSYKRS